jgi:hypothetical protein
MKFHSDLKTNVASNESLRKHQVFGITKKYISEPRTKGGKCFTKCLLMQSDITYHGGTTNIRNHLNNKHPSKFTPTP